MQEIIDEALKHLERYDDFIFPTDNNVFIAKAITFNGKNYPPYGNAVIVGGGTGSGKGFQISQLFGLNAKRIDIDILKNFALTNERVQERIKQKCGVDISHWRLNNSEQVSALHGFLQKIKLNEAYIDSVMKAARFAASDRKPNLIFDKTLKGVYDFKDTAFSLKMVGYKPENIHLVWVLNDYRVAIIQNRQRERQVDEDFLLWVHKSVADNMKHLIDMGNLIKKYMDGDFWISFNQAKVDVEAETSDNGGFYIKKAFYFKVKSAGESTMPYCKFDEKVKEKIIEYIPQDARNLWKK